MSEPPCSLPPAMVLLVEMPMPAAGVVLIEPWSLKAGATKALASAAVM